MKAVLRWNKNTIAEAIVAGEVVALPTDTVFALACNIRNEEAYEKILAIKGKHRKKLMAILVSDPRQIEIFAEMNPVALDLIHKHWPGPLTIILKKKSIFSHQHFNDETGIGFRMPNDKWLLSIIDKTGPIFATSANISGKPPLEDWIEIREELPETDLIVKDVVVSSPASTVVDTQTRTIKVLRKGETEI